MKCLMIALISSVIMVVLSLIGLGILLYDIQGFGSEVGMSDTNVRSEPYLEYTYGCLGCPDNFSDFTNDMCNRFPDYTISDGINSWKCNGSELK